MAIVNKFLFCLLVQFIGISCGNNGTDRQFAKENTVSIFNQPANAEQRAGTKPALFLSSKKIRIQYGSYGCFHSNSSYIDVEKTNQGYSVTMKDLFSTKPYTSIKLDSGFAAKLNQFAAFYTNLKALKEKQPLKKNTGDGTTQSISVTGGLECIEFHCENAYDLSGYNKLVNYINQTMAANN